MTPARAVCCAILSALLVLLAFCAPGAAEMYGNWLDADWR
jgi:hypothetical protein